MSADKDHLHPDWQNHGYALAQFVSEAEGNDDLLPLISTAITDGFACMLGGASSEVTGQLLDALVPSYGGDTPVYGTGKSLSPSYAAMVNAVSAHALDFDDWEDPGNTHPTAVVLPCLLAVASHACASLRPSALPPSGRDFAHAYAVGLEVIMRLGEVLTLDHYARGYHATATLGAIGAAAAAARLMRLTPDQTLHALSLSVSQAIGYTGQFGANAKALQAGFAARAGMESAVLAATGMTGQPHILTSRRGFVGLMGNYDADRLDQMVATLGKPWGLSRYGIVIKPWPSCGYTHRVMTAAQEARDKLAGRLDEITAIHVTMPDYHYAILPFGQPNDQNEALFSLPACLGQILIEGRLTTADLRAKFWHNKTLKRLITLTTVTPQPAKNMNCNYDPDQPDRIAITLVDGTKIEASCVWPLGSPQHPMAEETHAAKFHDLTHHPLSAYSQFRKWIDKPDIVSYFRDYH